MAMRIKDMTGQSFGRLEVLGPAEPPSTSKSRHAHWRCRCHCGQEKVISGYSLRYGRTQSCGCLQKDRTLATLATQVRHGTDRLFRTSFDDIIDRRLQEDDGDLD